MPFDIELDDYTLIRDADRRHLSSPKNAEVIEKKFGPLIEMGIFEESKSTWKAQLVVVKGKRVAHDFINVNKHTKIDPYPTTSLTEVMHKLAGSAIFSSLDADRGFMQVIATQREKEIISFGAVHNGIWRHYSSNVMLFGTVNSLATFNRNATVLLEPLLKQKLQIMNFVDDFCMYSAKDDWENHLKTWECMLQRAKEKNWKFGLAKMSFGFNKLLILGMMVSEAGISMDPHKVDAFANLQLPKNWSELASLFGLANWVRDLISCFAEKTATICGMLRNKEEVIWTARELEELKWLKEKLQEKPVLALPDMKRHSFFTQTRH